MAKRISLSRGVDPETLTQLKTLSARWGCSEGEAIDRAVALAAIEGPDQVAMLSEVLDLVRGLPDSEDMRFLVDSTMRTFAEERAAARAQNGQGFDPRTVPGIQTGAGNLRPRRESGAERTQREAQERQDRARAMDSTDDPSIDRSDEFVST